MNMKRISVFFCLLMVVVTITGCTRNDTENIVRREDCLKVYFFKSGEDEDAMLLMTPEATVMIDTGILEDAPALVDELTDLGVSKLDLLVLTHPDKDHIGGAALVLNTFEVTEVIKPKCNKNSEEQILLNNALGKEGLKVSTPKANTEYAFGDLKLVIYPPKSEEYDNTNDYSVAVLAEYADRRFFFAGDALNKRLSELLKENIGEVDVYKLPHHGRNSKKGEKMLEALKPKYCVVTAEKPQKDTRKAIAGIGADTLSTYEGEIIFRVEHSSGELTFTQKVQAEQ